MKNDLLITILSIGAIITAFLAFKLISIICERRFLRRLGSTYLTLLTHELIYGTTEINDKRLEYYKNFLELYGSKKGLVDLGNYIETAFKQSESIEAIVRKQIEYIENVTK